MPDGQQEAMAGRLLGQQEALLCGWCAAGQRPPPDMIRQSHAGCACRVRRCVCVCDCAGALAPVREPADQPRHTHAVPGSGHQRGEPAVLAAARAWPSLSHPVPGLAQFSEAQRRPSPCHRVAQMLLIAPAARWAFRMGAGVACCPVSGAGLAGMRYFKACAREC
jgi:hypothetical protein